MATKTVVGEAQQIKIAINLIEMGARLQLMQEETSLSRERLLRLYKEIKHESPSKGMLPYSTDWFMGWQANIHSSLFMNIYKFLEKNADIDSVCRLISAYRLYLDQVECIEGASPVLSITRAWYMLRFFKADMLQLFACRECDGLFVTHSCDLHANYACAICHAPARAGKTHAAKKAAMMMAQAA